MKTRQKQNEKLVSFSAAYNKIDYFIYFCQNSRIKYVEYMELSLFLFVVDLLVVYMCESVYSNWSGGPCS